MVCLKRSHRTSRTPTNTDMAVAHWWGGYWHDWSPAQINFLLFCSVWTLLALVYLIVVPWRFSETRAHHKFAILAAESLTMLFWFAGFLALAVFLSDRVCYGHVCSAAKASAVFGAFEWYVWLIKALEMCVLTFIDKGRCSQQQRQWPSCTSSAPTTEPPTMAKRTQI